MRSHPAKETARFLCDTTYLCPLTLWSIWIRDTGTHPLSGREGGVRDSVY